MTKIQAMKLLIGDAEVVELLSWKGENRIDHHPPKEGNSRFLVRGPNKPCRTSQDYHAQQDRMSIRMINHGSTVDKVS